MSYGALIQRPLGRSVLVGAAADEVDLEAAVVVQEHVGAVAVDRAVGEQHTDGESGRTSSGRFMNSLCASQYGFMVMARPAHRRSRNPSSFT